MKTQFSTLILSFGLMSTALAAPASPASVNRTAGSPFEVSAWATALKAQLDASPAKASAVLSPAALQALEAQILGPKNPQIATMLKARKLFAQNKFDQALSLYNQIQPGSDQWLEAVEEKGWAYHRQKDYQKALAQTKTLLSQAFAPVVGSEPFFLQSLSQLKICDYKGILDTHQQFKESQRTRLLEIKALAETGDSAAVSNLMSKVNQFPVTFKNVGEEAKALPRLFYRDVPVQRALLQIRLSQIGLEELQKRDSAKNSSLIANLNKIQKQASAQLKARMKKLARMEDEENFKMVQKLNLIEVETIQRIHADQELDRNTFSKGQFAEVSKDELVFPDDGHPWIDEVDKFQVRVNSCPQNIRRKM